VAAVSVDLDDPVSPGINVTAEPGADETDVLQRVRALLAAYGAKSRPHPPLIIGRSRVIQGQRPLGVDVRITPIKGGARIEVFGKTVRSFRIAPPKPVALAQGVADAWCQVVGKVPVEITEASVGDRGEMTVVAFDGEKETVGRSDVSQGWAHALAEAVGAAIGTVDLDARDWRLPSSPW
jgi:hypothetical protein